MTRAMQSQKHGLHSPQLHTPDHTVAEHDRHTGGVHRLARLALAELHAWRTALRDTSLYATTFGALLLALLVAVHLPLNYTIDVGKEEGYGSDLPHLDGFNTAESDIHGSFRWTDDGATIRLPGIGRRTVLVELDFFPVNAQVAEAGPKTIAIWSENQQLAVLPVRPDGARYTLIIPAQLLADGSLTLTLHTTTFTPPGDPRQLGTPLNRVTVTSMNMPILTLPDWRALGLWLLAALLGWVTLLRALGPIERARWWARRFFAVGAALIALAAILDPPRWAFGALPALITLACCYALVVVLRPLLTALATRLRVPLDPKTLGWLMLIIVVAFGMRYGGRLYPRSMHGDIGYHTNRFHDTTLGLVYLLSRNRGVDFPYPSGPYLTLAPFALLGIDTPALIQFSTTVVDSFGAALVFAMVAWTGQAVHVWRTDRPDRPVAPPRRPYLKTALLAAAVYVFTAAGVMTNWWSFSTHIYAQFATLVLVTALVYAGVGTLDGQPSRTGTAVPDASRRAIRGSLPGVLLVLMCGVFLGHFGFFINTALLIGLLLVVVWGAAWRGDPWARLVRVPLTMTFGIAVLIALVFFYSAYLPLFLRQAQAVAAGGLTGLAERAPVERSYLWHILWQFGLITHFGFFPILLAPLGMPTLTRWGRPGRMLLALMAGSFLVSAVFAILPFITLSTQSTRWLMFSAWAVAIGAAVAAELLWRYGRAGRLVVLAMAGFVLWNTAVIWLGGMLWRIRPPEPF